MPTKPPSRINKQKLKQLGKRIETIILQEKGFKSLDAFSIQFHDEITKPTLYDICAGRRDMKISTLFGLSAALEIPASELLKEL